MMYGQPQDYNNRPVMQPGLSAMVPPPKPTWGAPLTPEQEAELNRPVVQGTRPDTLEQEEAEYNRAMRTQSPRSGVAQPVLPSMPASGSQGGMLSFDESMMKVPPKQSATADGKPSGQGPRLSDVLRMANGNIVGGQTTADGTRLNRWEQTLPSQYNIPSGMTKTPEAEARLARQAGQQDLADRIRTANAKAWNPALQATEGFENQQRFAFENSPMNVFNARQAAEAQREAVMAKLIEAQRTQGQSNFDKELELRRQQLQFEQDRLKAQDTKATTVDERTRRMEGFQMLAPLLAQRTKLMNSEDRNSPDPRKRKAVEDELASLRVYETQLREAMGMPVLPQTVSEGMQTLPPGQTQTGQGQSPAGGQGGGIPEERRLKLVDQLKVSGEATADDYLKLYDYKPTKEQLEFIMTESGLPASAFGEPLQAERYKQAFSKPSAVPGVTPGHMAKSAYGLPLAAATGGASMLLPYLIPDSWAGWAASKVPGGRAAAEAAGTIPNSADPYRFAR